jgi:hypothetical protein
VDTVLDTRRRRSHSRWLQSQQSLVLYEARRVSRYRRGQRQSSSRPTEAWAEGVAVAWWIAMMCRRALTGIGSTLGGLTASEPGGTGKALEIDWPLSSILVESGLLQRTRFLDSAAKKNKNTGPDLARLPPAESPLQKNGAAALAPFRPAAQPPSVRLLSSPPFDGRTSAVSMPPEFARCRFHALTTPRDHSINPTASPSRSQSLPACRMPRAPPGLSATPPPAASRVATKPSHKTDTRTLFRLPALPV